MKLDRFVSFFVALVLFVNFQACSSARLGTAAVEGTADNFIRTSPSVKSFQRRLEGLESAMQKNMDTTKIMMNTVNHVTKMIDARLERIENKLMGPGKRFAAPKSPKGLFEL